MKPILILPPDQMSKEDMDRLRENDICVVEAKDPSLIRFCDPPPSGNYDQVTAAALELSRYIISHPASNWYGRELASYWAQAIMNGHQLCKSRPPQVETVKKTKGRGTLSAATTREKG